MPRWRAAASSDGETGPSGRTSDTVEVLAAETDAPDRSERFFEAVKAGHAEGLTPGDVEEVMRRHPEGCAGKYLDPYDRLRREIAIILVDHHLDLALALSDRTVALERGSVQWTGESRLLREDQELRRKVLWL